MTRLDDTLAFWAATVDILAFNRAIGLGVGNVAVPGTIDALTDAFTIAGAPRFMIQLCPDAQPATLRGWLEARGFTHHNNWVKLWRDVSPIEARPTDLRVEQIDRDRRTDFAHVLGTGFGFPESIAPWSGAAVGADGWRHYLAMDGDTPCGTGALFVRGEVGWLGMAATLATHRGRGSQGALIARRVSDAAKLGCRFVVVETAEETPARPAPSYRNMIRFGFQVAYLRPNFVKVLRTE